MFCLNSHLGIVFLCWPEFLCCLWHEESALVTWAEQMPLHQGGAVLSPLCPGHLGIGFIRGINKSIPARVWVREFPSCFSLSPACPSALVLIGTTQIFLTLITCVSCWMLGLGLPGNCRGDFPEVLPDPPGIALPGLHPSSRLWVVLFPRSLLLTCHRGRWWD